MVVRTRIVLLAALVVLSSASSDVAAKSVREHYGDRVVYKTRLQDLRDQAQNRRNEWDSAKAALEAARKNQELVKVRLQQEAKNSMEMKAAMNEKLEAQKAHDAARLAVLAELRQTAPYQAAMSKKDQADQDKKTLALDAPAATRMAAATRCMEMGSVLTRMEAEAREANAPYVEARKRLYAAEAKINELELVAVQAMRSNAQWIEAQAEFTTKTAEVASADKAYKQADKLFREEEARDNNRR